MIDPLSIKNSNSQQKIFGSLCIILNLAACSPKLRKKVNGASGTIDFMYQKDAGFQHVALLMEVGEREAILVSQETNYDSLKGGIRVFDFSERLAALRDLSTRRRYQAWHC